MAKEYFFSEIRHKLIDIFKKIRSFAYNAIPMSEKPLVMGGFGCYYALSRAVRSGVEKDTSNLLKHISHVR